MRMRLALSNSLLARSRCRQTARGVCLNPGVMNAPATGSLDGVRSLAHAYAVSAAEPTTPLPEA
jgi:hypothetical protein